MKNPSFWKKFVAWSMKPVWRVAIGIAVAIIIVGVALALRVSFVDKTGITQGFPSPTVINSTGITTTKITPQPGDRIEISSGQLVPMDIDQLILESSCILIGRVVDILASQETATGGNFGTQGGIYTNVIIQPIYNLYGKSDNEPVAVRIEGGRIDGLVTLVEDQPEFDLGEDSLLFLYRPDNTSAFIIPSGIRPSDYFLVTGLTQGKFTFKNGIANSVTGENFSLSDLEKKIKAIRTSN